MRLPIDTSAMTILCAGPPEAVLDFESKRPKLDEGGQPLYSVQLVALIDGGAEVIGVKIAGEPKGLSQGTTVRITRLVATPWSMGDRNGIAFRAARIDAFPPGGPARAAA